MVAGFKSESRPASLRNIWPECVRISRKGSPSPKHISTAALLLRLLCRSAGLPEAGEYRRAEQTGLRRIIFVINAHDGDFRDGEGCDQEPVLVDTIKLVQPEEMATIRAYEIGNDLCNIGGKSLYFSVTRLRYQRLPVLIYREARAFSGLTESAGFSLGWICNSTFVSNRHGGSDGQAIFSGLA